MTRASDASPGAAIGPNILPRVSSPGPVNEKPIIVTLTFASKPFSILIGRIQARGSETGVCKTKRTVPSFTISLSRAAGCVGCVTASPSVTAAVSGVFPDG